MTDAKPQLTIEEKAELLVILYGYSEDEARELAADPEVEIFDVIIDGKPYVGPSIFNSE